MKSSFKWASFLSVVFVIVLPNFAIADDFSIEDKDLISVPKEAVIAIEEADPYIEESCHFIGKPISLSGQSPSSDLIVTTENACDWAANAGPVWVLKKEGESYNVVLSFITYTVTIEEEKNNGLRNITTSRSTANLYEIEFWSYVEDDYQQMQDYFFSADDKETCLAHRDICPWHFD
jgi:hypothetical protein